MKTRSFRFMKGVMLHFYLIATILYLSFPFTFYLISTNGYLLSPPFYIYLFYQNDLIHMPFFSSYTAFHLSHSLVHSLQNFLFNKHSLKAMHSFTIKYFQVGYLF